VITEPVFGTVAKVPGQSPRADLKPLRDKLLVAVKGQLRVPAPVDLPAPIAFEMIAGRIADAVLAVLNGEPK
jgi:hypothetical protein